MTRPSATTAPAPKSSPSPSASASTGRSWTADQMPPQHGRRVVITGANSGIGFEAALELARHGAAIILPARSEAKAADAIRRIRAAVPAADLTPALLDLASLDSVRAFAAMVEERFPGPSLDLLINNAGVMALPRREITEDGYERQFATNVLGPFALTALLFPRLKPIAGTRIVTLSSIAAHGGKIAFDNLQGERAYSPLNGAYTQSKLADLIFALELQRRLGAAGSPIASLAAHPGIAVTNLQANLKGIYKLLGPLLMPLIGHSARQGALPELFAATAPEALAGGYYGPNGIREIKGDPAPAKLPPASTDCALASRLWTTAEQLTGIRFDVGG
ncbi:oxidoreductase [Segnochrobactrum spirostomi]|uniref:SDR family NAD(P)-dependent oxidoreductase n=1 Tax=Segnochrobactrum spirostomi TaxID=2608987 RepID=A0A6A7Y2I2_9HYPH|nr:oxidoreductase [Segnochrobactrum spirostomi]MQT12925.1 SDR family NAD(P)-dependent oxidoreductase [Segnochrobactrum spirostomi]